LRNEGKPLKLTVGIVGGAGKMGLLLARNLKDKIETLRIISRDTSRAIEAAEGLGVEWAPIEEAHRNNILIVSVPIDETVAVCKSLGQRMAAGSLLVDLASVKTGIADTVANSTPVRIEYLSLHPLFGPQVKDMTGKRWIAVQARGGPLTDELLKILAKSGAVVKKATVKEHDEAMAAIQVLHHYALLVFSAAINRISSGKVLTDYVTESLEKTLQNIEVMEENWGTIYAIQRLNPHSHEARETFAKTANEMLELDEDAKVHLERAISMLKPP